MARRKTGAAVVNAADLFDGADAKPDANDERPRKVEGVPVPTAPSQPEAPSQEVEVEQRHEIALWGVNILACLERQDMALKAMREFVLRRTRPSDWVAFGVEGTTETTLYLRASGCGIARQVFQVEVSNLRPRDTDGNFRPKLDEQPKVELKGDRRGEAVVDEHGKNVMVRTASGFADGVSRITRMSVTDVMSVVSSGNWTGSGSYADLVKSCRTDLEAKVIRILAGFTRVSRREIEELKLGWSIEDCAKGAGFGSAKDRRSAGVAEPGVAEALSALKAEVTRRTGGDLAAMRQLCLEITRSGDFKGFDSLDRLAKDWQVANASKALKLHPIFGDAQQGPAVAAAPSGMKK